MDSETRHKAIRGMAWSTFERFATQIVQFIISIVLARILMPSDYGLVGMLSIFFAISYIFINSGFSQALIQKKDKKEEDYNTIFLFNIGTACVFYALLYFGAPYIAEFYNQPKLTPITRVYALILVINSLASVQSTILTIRLSFGALAKVSIISVVVSGIAGIIMAYSGFGVWALVWQGIISASVNSLTLFLLCRWIPSFTFSWLSFRSLFSFGSKLVISSLINAIFNNISSLIIGKAFNASELGYYNRAEGFSHLPPNTVTSVVLKVNYPILAKVQDDHSKLLSSYATLLRTPILLLYPIMFGMAVLAVPMITVLVGDKWLPSASLLPILCFTGLWTPLTHINLNLLYVKGRTDLVLKLELIKKPIAFILLIAAVPLGIKAICASVALYSFIAFTFNCYYTGKILDYGFWKQIREILPILGYSTLMGLIIWLSTFVIGNDLLKLIVGIPLGAISYYTIARLCHDHTLESLRQMAIARMPKLAVILR